MARRSSYNSPPPPRAFMGSSESSVSFALGKLAKEQRHMATRHISVEDFRQIYVPMGYRHSLQEAFSFTKFNTVKQELRIRLPVLEDYPIGYRLEDPDKPATATFYWDYNMCPTGFFVPKTFTLTRQPDAPPEAIERLEYMLHELARISFEFGLVRHVFQQLNQNGYCNTPAQMRYVWPAIRHIVDKADLKDLAPSLIEASARAGDKARVPPEVTALLVPTTDIINRTTLIPKIDLSETREFSHITSTAGFVISPAGDKAASFAGMS
jgi:hypothetical protein